MTPFLSWVDFNTEQKKKMNEIIRLFDEAGVRDELGIGVIRDAIADHLFPGTSTIQTRARYFFFVPYMYLSLEEEVGRSRRLRENPQKIQAWVEKYEQSLRDTLLRRVKPFIPDTLVRLQHS